VAEEKNRRIRAVRAARECLTGSAHTAFLELLQAEIEFLKERLVTAGPEQFPKLQGAVQELKRILGEYTSERDPA
jgi:hypothetical protein